MVSSPQEFSVPPERELVATHAPVSLPSPGVLELRKQCKPLLTQLWKLSCSVLKDDSGLDDRGMVLNYKDPDGDWWSHTAEVRHIVHGRPGGRWGAVECSWLRLPLRGMKPLVWEQSEELGWNTALYGHHGPVVGFHGTRWPTVPWILQDGLLTAGPRDAGGRKGVWTASSFKTAEQYAWPEPLGPPWCECTPGTKSSERWQVVFELQVLQRQKHSNAVYVTKNVSKASLVALHLRPWREGSEDHPELEQGYFPSGFWPEARGTNTWRVASPPGRGCSWRKTRGAE